MLTKWIKSKLLYTILLLIVSASASILTVIDALYFKFLKERISYDFLGQLNPDNNISLWTYISDYWPMAVLIIVLISGFTLWVRMDYSTPTKPHWISLIAIIVCLVIVARGGFRLKPIRTADTGQHLKEDSHVVAFNTVLYLIETWQNPISAPSFIETTLPTIQHTQFSNDSIQTPNFVIIILEGFGKEYTGLNRGMTHTYTPFLNSLIPQSVCCHNAYANGLKSVDAVPAIFSSIPKLTNTAFIHSPHSSAAQASVFNLLATLGYSSSFFHGADNQSMGFKSYLKTNGLQQYFGVDEYPHTDKDHDGHWGIYDLPYLQYVSRELSDQKQPFVSSVFTLSSHHPYSIPVDLKDSFTEGDIPIHKSIQYSDYALQQFFETSKNEAWFDNTIFIITADHSAENLLHAYRTPSGKYEIPLLIFGPGTLQPSSIRKTVAQIDILPTILDLVNYPDSVLVLGESIFTENHNRTVCHYDNNVYHVTQNHWSYGITQNQATFLYNKKQDINCLSNELKNQSDKAQILDTELKALVRNYFYVIKQD